MTNTTPSPISVEFLITLFRQAQSKQRDCTLAIDGFVGEGKSTFALQCLKQYYNVTRIDQFKKLCQRYMIYNRKDLYTLATEEKEKLIIADESINLLFRREWQNSNQIVLLKAFDVCRDNKNIFIFNIPSFWALDSHTVQTRIRFWVHVDKQKFATLFKPIRHPFASDVWCRRYNEKLFERKRGVKQSPNHVRTFLFEPLKPEEYAVADEIKREKRLNVDGKEEKEESPPLTMKQLCREIKRRHPKASTSAIARAVGSQDSSVARALRDYEIDVPPRGTNI